MSTIETAKVVAQADSPVSIPNARHYCGCMLHSGGAAATVRAYRGAASTPANLVGGALALISTSAQDTPSSPVTLDHGDYPANQGLYIVVTGAGAAAIVRYIES